MTTPTNVGDPVSVRARQQSAAYFYDGTLNTIDRILFEVKTTTPGGAEDEFQTFMLDCLKDDVSYMNQTMITRVEKQDQVTTLNSQVPAYVIGGPPEDWTPIMVNPQAAPPPVEVPPPAPAPEQVEPLPPPQE